MTLNSVSQRSRCWMCAFALLLLSNSPVSALEDKPTESAKELLLRACAAVEQIRCLSMVHETLAEPGSAAAAEDSGATVNKAGRPVYSLTRFWWDHRKMTRMEMRQWMPELSRPAIRGAVYDHFTWTVTKGLYRGRSDSSHRAKIASNWSRSSPGFVTPLLFLGHRGLHLDTHLCRYLTIHGEILSPDARSVEGGLEIQARYDPPGPVRPRTVRLVIDPDWNHLPVEIETRIEWCNTVEQNIRVTEFAILSDTVVPIAGSAAYYSVREIYPNGLTTPEINAMSRERYLAEVEPRVQRFAKLVSLEQGIRLDVRNLSINNRMPPSFYHLSIPDSYELTDLTRTESPSSDD